MINKTSSLLILIRGQSSDWL